MPKINEYIMYKRDVCKIIAIKEKYYKDKDYYVLVPVSDNSLKTLVPIDSSNLKNLITKEEINALIKKMSLIPVINSNSKLIENEYKTLIASDNYEDLIKVIKTTYLRNQNRINNHKRIGDKDEYYFLKAENYLYQEFAIVLDMSVDEVRNYIIREITKENK